MSLLEYEECLALSWTNTGDVFGVRVKLNNHKLELLDAMTLSSEDDSYASMIAKISKKLLQPSTHIIIAGGAFKESVCFDFFIPTMAEGDIRQAIQYELPRHLPYGVDDIFFGYRVISTKSGDESDESDNSKILIRAFVITKSVWHELLTDFTSVGVKVDVIVHPFMIIDPILQKEESIYLSNIDKDFKYKKRECEAGREMVRLNEEDLIDDKGATPSSIMEQLNYEHKTIVDKISNSKLESYIPSLMEAAFILSPEGRVSKSSFIELPKELIPERFRFLRSMFFIFLAMVFSFIVAFVGRALWEDWSRLTSLKDATKEVNISLAKIRSHNNLLSNFEDGLLAELKDANVGNENIARCFHKLSLILPKKAWLTTFTSRNDVIDMTIKSTPGQLPRVVQVLNSSGFFKTKSPNKRANSDGTESIYIHMNVLKPSFLKGGK